MFCNVNIELGADTEVLSSLMYLCFLVVDRFSLSFDLLEQLWDLNICSVSQCPLAINWG